MFLDDAKKLERVLRQVKLTLPAASGRDVAAVKVTAMRDDMFKVIVERPRLRIPKRAGSHYPRGRLKNAFARDLDQAPRRESLGGRYGYKSLNENLAPLVRYLRSQVGRLWNKVHSEICEHLSVSSAVQKHLLDHLADLVSTRVELRGDQLWSSDRHGRPRLLESGWRDQFYVAPGSGMLTLVPSRRSKARAPWKRTCGAGNPNIRVVNGSVELHRLNGVWFEIRFMPTPPEPRGWKVYDVLLRREVEAARVHLLRTAHGRPDRPLSFAAVRRQLDTREIRQLLGGAT